MKRILTLAIFCLFVSLASAQTSGTPEVRASKQIVKLERGLQLGDSQKEKIKEILVARFTATDAVKASSAPADDKESRLAQIRREKDAEIIALLTPEQTVKFKEMRNNENLKHKQD